VLRKIILRADGNNVIGMGHIYRLLALAEVLKGENYHLAFATSVNDAFIQRSILDICDELIPMPEFDYCMPDKKALDHEMPFDLQHVLEGQEIVITDGYWFGTNYQKQIKNCNCRLISIDDLAQWYFISDVVINHAPGIDTSLYKVAQHTSLYTGLDYMILRKPFYKPANKQRFQHSEKHLFLCLGGSDQFEFTSLIAQNVIPYIDLLRVLISGNYSAPLKEKLFRLKADHPHKIEIYEDVDASVIVSMLDKSTHAIVSSSNVAIEAVARGIKPLVGYYTKNQLMIYHGLLKIEKASGLGNFHNFRLESLREYLTHNLPSHAIDSSVVVQNLRKIIAE